MEHINDFANRKMNEEGREGVLEVLEFREKDRVDEGISRRVRDLVDEGEWPRTINQSDHGFEMKVDDETVCSGEWRERQRPGGPRQISPRYRREPKFDEDCDQFHKDLLRYEVMV